MVRPCLTVGGGLLLILAFAGPARALTYYVRATGSDTNDGLSPATARASIRGAAALLHAPGDRLVVGPGLYREGNIQPLGSGTPDEPIVLLADVTGTLTRDAPGPVIIAPPNTADATTGFIIFGRRDIRIEGFTIQGAHDAGIQVRPHFSLLVDSSRITIRNNTIRSGSRKGIDVTATGDVEVTDNLVSRHIGPGVALRGGASGPLRPLITGNVIEKNDDAIALENTFGAIVSSNTLRGNRRGVSAVGGSDIAIDANDIDSRDEALAIASGDVAVTGNALRRGASIRSTGSVLITRNQFLDTLAAAFVTADGGDVVMLDNALPRIRIGGSAMVEIAGNTATRLEVGGAEVTAADNVVDEGLRVSAATAIELRDNRSDGLTASAPAVQITRSQVSRQANVDTRGGAVVNNRFGALVMLGYPSTQPGSEDSSLLVAANTVNGMMHLSEAAAPASGTVVQDNTVGGLLDIYSRGELEVRRNQARGIACFGSAESAHVLAENVASGNVDSGLVVDGAGRAVVEDNTAANNEDAGLIAHAIGTLVIARNTFTGNGAGGINILVQLAGDCDSNRLVTIDELLAGVNIALGRRYLSECSPADPNADRRVTIDELTRAVAAALGFPGTAGAVEIRANRVADNARFGINVLATAPVLAVGNDVLRNEGIAIAARSLDSRAAIDIADNVLGLGGGEGVYVEGSGAARVRNNVIFSHREAGILLRNTPGAAIVNNLIYANGNDGIAVGTGDDAVLPASGTLIMNNTLYANGDFGVTIGTPAAPSTGVTLLNNIIDGNASGGIAADADSLSGLTIGFNLNTDGYGHGVTPSVTDFVADPRFVAPAGADGVLGGEGFADDDFHLRDSVPASAAIDAGSSTAAALHITGSAIAGREIDEGIVDLGYHYGAADGESRP